MPMLQVIQNVPVLSGVNSIILSDGVMCFITPKSLMTTVVMQPLSVLASTVTRTGTPLMILLGERVNLKSMSASVACCTLPVVALPGPAADPVTGCCAEGPDALRIPAGGVVVDRLFWPSELESGPPANIVLAANASSTMMMTADTPINTYFALPIFSSSGACYTNNGDFGP